MSRPVRPDIAAARELESEPATQTRPAAEPATTQTRPATTAVARINPRTRDVAVEREPLKAPPAPTIDSNIELLDRMREPPLDEDTAAAIHENGWAGFYGPGTAPDTQLDEQALIGAVLQGYEDVGGLARIVGPADMYEPAHEAIWDAIVGLWEDGVKPTVVMVVDRLGMEAHRLLPGGPTYLSSLYGSGIHAMSQAEFYAEKVREHAIMRQIGALGIRAQQIVGDADATSEQFLSGLSGWLDKITAAKKPHSTGLASALERVINTAEHGQKLCLETPWEDINDLLGGGLYPGQLIVLGARPGAGKSMMAENIATHVARTPGCEALFCSLEMSEEELVTRTLAWTAQVPLNNLRAGGSHLTEQHWEKIARAQKYITATHLTIVDDADQTARSIRMEARRVAMNARRNGRRLGVVVVDYAGLVTGSSDRMNERQVINEVSREMKKLAKELACTVILCAQLNRNGADRKNPRPLLTDLKESGSLEQDADVVILLWVVEEDSDGSGVLVKTGDVEVIVPKQRNGPTSFRKLKQWGHYQTFRSIAS